MGPGALFYIFGYFGFVIAIGAILLKRIPRWRLTTVNLVVFVVSATARMFALSNFVVRTFDVFKYLPLGRAADVTYLFVHRNDGRRHCGSMDQIQIIEGADRDVDGP